MQIVLIKDVERLGSVGDVVDVKTGYARNYLMPHGFAATVTSANMRRVDLTRKKLEEARQAEDRELAGVAERMKSASITIAAKANEEGHLFGSVSAAQIAEMLQAEGYKVDEKMIQLTEPIKEVGVVEVPVQLKPDLVSSCKVWVVAE